MYTAVIVEPRRHPALGFVLRNAVENLPAEWKILVFHGTTNHDFLESILNTLPRDRFLTPIPLGMENLTRYDYNALLTSVEFYRAIPTEIHLIFQTDTVILSEHRHFLRMFLRYDYVGAPWKNGWVGNGGLSLRRTATMREVCERITPEEVIHDVIRLVEEQYGTQSDISEILESVGRHSKEEGKILNEDIYFSYQRAVPMSTPDASVAQYFSVESVFCETPWGVHAPWKHLKKNEMEQLLTRYPEIRQSMELNNRRME
jgi:hypothetical protein